jgi:hypothetical protein
MVNFNRSSLVIGTVAAALVCAQAPVQAAPWAKSGVMAATPLADQVGWRGRRNGAIVVGAIGLGVLGIAAAAAASERRGYYSGGYSYGPGYGYGHAPSYGYAAPQVYEYEYIQPRRRYVEAPVYGYRPVYGQGGYGHHRHGSGGLNRSQIGRDRIETGGR